MTLSGGEVVLWFLFGDEIFSVSVVSCDVVVVRDGVLVM